MPGRRVARWSGLFAAALWGTLLSSASALTVLGPEGEPIAELETQPIGGVTYWSATDLRALFDGQRTPFRAQYRYTAPTGNVSLRIAGPEAQITLRMRIGSRTVELRDGATLGLDAPPRAREGTVWLPLQLLVETLPELLGFTADYHVEEDRLRLDWNLLLSPEEVVPSETVPTPGPEIPYRPQPPQPARWVQLRPVLDPGHGDQDLGVQRNGLVEKELTLAVARRVAALGAAVGTRVVLTRTDDSDPSPQERTETLQRTRGTVFLTLHFNASPNRNDTGYRLILPTVYRSDSERPAKTSPRSESEQLAQLLAQALNRAGFVGKIWQLPIPLLPEISVPSVQVVLGYLSHPAEATLWQQPQTLDRAAEAIWAALANFLPEEGRR